MTRRNHLLTPIALGALGSALLLGCGNSTSSNVPADWTASPSSTLPSSSLTDIDVAGTTATGATINAAAVSGPQAEAVAPDCHPALFERTYEIADILNNHTHKMMDRIADIVRHPKALDGSPNCTVDDKAAPTQISCTIDRAAGLFGGYPLTLTWVKTVASGVTNYATNVYIQPSSTTAANLHECELSAGANLPAACTKIFSASLNLTTNANGFDVSSASPMVFDFTALNSVDPSEAALGTFQVNVDFTKDATKPNPYRRVLGFTFDNFAPAVTAEEMAAGDVSHGLRSGTLAHVGYTGSGGGGGGAMEFVDEVILYCPLVSGSINSSLYSDALTVGRWYLDTAAGSTSLFARVDAEAVADAGGTSPTGVQGTNNQLGSNTYIGGVCFSGSLNTSASTIAASANDNWMFVEEDNNNVAGSTYVCGPESTPGDTSTCNAACGGALQALPTVSNGQLVNGYPFTGLSPSVASSGIPVDPSGIETALEPLLCATGVGTAWTGQSVCQ